MEHLTTSIIICTRNRLPDLINCLTSLTGQTKKPDQVIIVDSSSVSLSNCSEFHAFFNTTQFPASQLIYRHTQPGLTLQRNVGISLASGSLTYFFDDDVILSPNYLEKMTAIFETHAHYAGGMGTITNMAPYKNNFFRWQRKFFLLQRDYAKGSFTFSGMPTHAYGQQQFQSVDVVGGCCMVFRTRLLQEYTFDEKLPYYAALEDVDFSWRISQKHKLFYNPAAQLEHHNSPLNRDKLYESRAMYMRHYRYHFFKNVYSEKKIILITHWWSIMGLFIEALLFERSMTSIQGYLHGLLTPLKTTITQKKLFFFLLSINFLNLSGMDSHNKLSTLDDAPLYYATLAHLIDQQPANTNIDWFGQKAKSLHHIHFCDARNLKIFSDLASLDNKRALSILHMMSGVILQPKEDQCSFEETKTSYTNIINQIKKRWRFLKKTEQNYIFEKKSCFTHESNFIANLAIKCNVEDIHSVGDEKKSTLIISVDSFKTFGNTFNFDCIRLAKARAKITWILTKARKADGTLFFPFPKEIKQLITMLAYPYGSDLS